MLKYIAFDADDTLWHNEIHYVRAEEKVAGLLERFIDREQFGEYLLETEKRNIRIYGYGIKSFTLSLFELTIAISQGAVGADELQHILDLTREMLVAPVELIEGVERVLRVLSNQFQLMIITKGDLIEQGRKVKLSGLERFFGKVEIVAEKSESTYSMLFEKHDIHPKEILMVGNSLRSDIMPVLSLGGNAVYIPQHLTWKYETVYEGQGTIGDIPTLAKISLLPAHIFSYYS